MKSILATTFFLLFGLLCTCHSQTDAPARSSSRSANGIVLTPLRFVIKEKNLWNSRTGTRYLNANLLYNRSTSQINDFGLCTSSSYTIPLLYGYRFNQSWAFEGGVFGGLNRNRLAGTSALGPDLGVAQNNFAYGLIGGFAYDLRQDVDLKFRYRYDIGSDFHAWNPVQLGLSFSF
ncbi:MAG: hypothetical protein AAGF87_14480 [Bacteroidota bacterium]